VHKVCPGTSQNKVCARCFDVGVGVTGHDVVVCRVKGSIVANDQIASSIDVDPAVVTCRHVAVETVSSTRHMNTGPVTGARPITLTGITFEATLIVHRDAISRVCGDRATSNGATGGCENASAGVTAHVAVTDRAGGARGDSPCAILG